MVVSQETCAAIQLNYARPKNFKHVRPHIQLLQKFAHVAIKKWRKVRWLICCDAYVTNYSGA